MVTFISHSASETEDLGVRWADEAQPGWVIGLSGELGAGKTQLVRGLARGLGAPVRVHSPTFALIHEYRGGRWPLFHIDLYRLNTVGQIIDAGLEIYLTRPDGIAVVEWFERWAALPSGRFRRAEIRLRGENEREIHYEDSGD